VLIPQVLASGPGGAARTGLLLSALPVGFGLAALLGDLLLPKTWNDRRRSLAGALLTCAVMGASVVVPVNQATVVPQLALAGLGLGIFVPPNNTVIMRGTADSSASLVGGLVSMARGIGTTFGISLMALAWHLGSHSYPVGNPGYSGSEQARPAFARARGRSRDGRRDRAGQPHAAAGTSGAAEGGEPVRCRPPRDAQRSSPACSPAQLMLA
jgi:MFS family permease